MTIETIENRISYTGSGGTGPFAFPYYFLSSSDLVVIKVTIADGTEVTLNLTTDYTVTGDGDEDGGSVTLISSLSSDYKLVIYRSPAQTQTVSYPRNDPFPAESHEMAIDKLTMIAQRLSDRIDRTLRQTDGDVNNIALLPVATDRANTYLAFDADGDPVATSGTSSLAIISTFMETVLDDTSAAAARTTLGTFVSVKDFGAVGDGVTDDSAAIQSAVDSGASIVWFQAGDYKVNTSVNITSTIRLLGGGIDFAMTGQGVTNITTSSTTEHLFKINADNVIIDGINITGTGARAVDATKGAAIQVGTVTRTVTDASMSASSAVISSATANFTAADVGSYVHIPNAYSGTSTPYILSIGGATTATLSSAANNNVSGQTAVIAPVILGTTLRNVSMSSHSIGVDFKNASNFTLEDCHLNSFYAIRVDNVAPDKGDSQIIGCHLSAAALSNSACIRWEASGGLRITNCKFLDAYDHIQIDWSTGTSGGPNISNCSFENMTHYAINATGDSSKVMNGFVFTGNWVNGGQRQIHIDNTLVLTNANITGNIFANGSAVTMLYIGAATSRFDVCGNLFDGANVGSAAGISVASGATSGLIEGNRIVRVTTPISNTNATVFNNYYDEGTWTPVLTFATPGNLSVAYSKQVGTYTRKGRSVQLHCDVATSTFTHTTASGACQITGLPFNSANITNSNAFGPVSWGGITKASYTSVASVISANSGTIVFNASGSGVAISSVSAADMPTAGTVALNTTINYQI